MSETPTHPSFSGRASLVAAAQTLALALSFAALAPALAGIGDQAAALRSWLLLAGLLAGGAAAPRSLRVSGGAQEAVRGGVALAASGTLGAVLLAFALARRLGGSSALALALAGTGITLGVALIFSLAGASTPPARATPSGSGAPIRLLVALTCGALAIASWALAFAHVVGTRVSDGDRQAIDEARDLVSIASARLGDGRDADLDGLAARLAPAGGYLVSVDEEGRVLAGAGAGVAPSSTIEIGDSHCRSAARSLPCALRRHSSQARLIAAVPVAPVPSAWLLWFAAAGLIACALAFGVGALVAAAPARELDRVAVNLDELARGQQTSMRTGLERSITVASLDEIGELADALNRLRARLDPIVAEYRQALAKAQAADRARDEFLALVSAELRAPLDELVAATEALLDPGAESLTTEQADDVSTIRSAARHLSDLIGEVLDVSAIASGRVTLRLEELDLGQLAADVAKSQRPLLARKGVEMRVDIQEPSPRVTGDVRRLRQVLTNLISNAVKFTEKGSIEVVVRRRGQGRARADDPVDITVRDTGPGIAPEALPRLFQEFVQLGSLKQRAHGTGLGLAICKRLVEAHGGEVSAESEVGKGSTFRVVVPSSGPSRPSRAERAPE